MAIKRLPTLLYSLFSVIENVKAGAYTYTEVDTSKMPM